MQIYIYSILVIFVALFMSRNIPKLKHKALFASFIILWLISGLRDVSVGTDTVAYSQYFSLVRDGQINILDSINFPNIFIVNGFESGFAIYNYVSSLLFKSFTSFLLLTYGFMYYSFYRFIKKYSSDYLMSMMIFITLFYFGSMNTLRQFLAMSILVWGFESIINRRFYRYLLIVLLATLIHQVSIIMIIPYFLYNKRIGNSTLLLYSTITIPTLLFIDKIVYSLAADNPRYSFYIDRLNSFSLGSYFSLIVITSMTLALYVLYRSNINHIGKNLSEILKINFYLKMMLLSTVSSIIALRVNSFGRVTELFLIFAIVSIPAFIKLNVNVRLVNSYKLIFIIVLFTLCFGSLMLKPEWLMVTQYKFVSG